jgi:hypothetical protein
MVQIRATEAKKQQHIVMLAVTASGQKTIAKDYFLWESGWMTEDLAEDE